MTSYVARDATHLGADRIATSPTAFALYENLKAVLEKDSTAVSAGWVLANSYVVEAMLAASSVSQGKLKTALNTIATSSTGTDGSNQTILSGGQYCFGPTIQIGAGTGGDRASVVMGVAIATDGASAVALPWDVGGTGVNTTFTSNLSRNTEYTAVMWHDAGDDAMTINVRYVQASPPYDLGEGEVPLFVFVQLDKSGNVKQVWTAQDPPWANNGPTVIRPDLTLAPEGGSTGGIQVRFERDVSAEDRAALRDPLKRPEALARIKAASYRVIPITHALKNKDMPLIPHPFASGKPDDVAVMLPIGSLLEELGELERCGENVAGLIGQGYIHISNEKQNRIAPPGVLPVRASWKLS
jgi:hypothetical protein